jgi:hypothetical protein
MVFMILVVPLAYENVGVAAARAVAGPRLVDATVIARLAEAVRDRLY